MIGLNSNHETHCAVTCKAVIRQLLMNNVPDSANPSTVGVCGEWQGLRVGQIIALYCRSPTLADLADLYGAENSFHKSAKKTLLCVSTMCAQNSNLVGFSMVSATI